MHDFVITLKFDCVLAIAYGALKFGCQTLFFVTLLEKVFVKFLHMQKLCGVLKSQ